MLAGIDQGYRGMEEWGLMHDRARYAAAGGPESVDTAVQEVRWWNTCGGRLSVAGQRRVFTVLRSTITVLIATLHLCSCATVVSTVISPISGPVDVFIQLGKNRTGVVETCVVAVAAPLLSLLSPFAGFMCGLREDCEGSYVWSRILRPWWNLPSH